MIYRNETAALNTTLSISLPSILQNPISGVMQPILQNHGPKQKLGQQSQMQILCDKWKLLNLMS